METTVRFQHQDARKVANGAWVAESAKKSLALVMFTRIMGPQLH